RAGHAGVHCGARVHRPDVQRPGRPADRRLRPREVRVSVILTPEDRPRPITPAPSLADQVFRNTTMTISIGVLAIFAAIGGYLFYQSIPTLQRYGLHFFVENRWNPENDIVGISAVMVGTFLVAAVALIVSFPLAISTALYISEYASPRMRGFLVAA